MLWWKSLYWQSSKEYPSIFRFVISLSFSVPLAKEAMSILMEIWNGVVISLSNGTNAHTHLLLIDNKSNYIINMADRMIETSGEKEMKNISIANNLNHVALISMAMKLCCKTSKGKKMEYVFQNERKQKLLWKWKENRKSNRNWSQHGNVQGAWIRHCGYQTPTKAFGHIYNTSNRNKCAVHFIYMRIYNTNMHDLLRMHKHIICGVFSSSPTSLDRIWNWQNKLCTFHWKIE